MASARGWFPLVGLLLGLILASLEILRMLMLQAGSSGWYGYAPLPVTYPVFLNYTILLWSVLLVVILVVLTRALHLDGFMDSCDALLGVDLTANGGWRYCATRMWERLRSSASCAFC